MDEHVAHAIVRALRHRAIDVLTVGEANRLADADDEHLAFALSEGRVTFTQDADFLAFASRGHPHADIAYAPQGTPLRELIQGLTLIAQVLSAEEMVGRVEFL
jgi:hypothetical protein